jgi:hypothetical protein
MTDPLWSAIATDPEGNEITVEQAIDQLSSWRNRAWRHARRDEMAWFDRLIETVRCEGGQPSKFNGARPRVDGGNCQANTNIHL